MASFPSQSSAPTGFTATTGAVATATPGILPPAPTSGASVPHGAVPTTGGVTAAAQSSSAHHPPPVFGAPSLDAVPCDEPTASSILFDERRPVINSTTGVVLTEKVDKQSVPIAERFPSDETMRFVRFMHPFYDEGTPAILQLVRVDTASIAGETTWGVHYGTALTACAIIAGNRFDGYFALSRTGDRPQKLPWDAILTERTYYFFVPGMDRYPIVPVFEDWRFPELGLIPPEWFESVKLLTRKTPDGLCIVKDTGYTEKAHVVPQEHSNWWRLNSSRLSIGSNIRINDLTNKVNLTQNLHHTLDNYVWTFAPRFGRLAVHVLDGKPNTPSQHSFPRFHADNHGLQVRSLQESNVFFFFARFAWSVINFVKNFMEYPSEKLVVRYRVWERHGAKLSTEIIPGGAWFAETYTSSSRSRSQSVNSTSSPANKKRRRTGYDDDSSAGEDSPKRRHISEWADHVVVEPDSLASSFTDHSDLAGEMDPGPKPSRLILVKEEKVDDEHVGVASCGSRVRL